MKRVAFGLIALAALCGCNSSDNNASTGTGGGAGGSGEAPCWAPCGGDIVGKWRIVSSCGSSSYQMTIPNCTDPLDVRQALGPITGTAEYRADGTYTVSMTYSATMRQTYPPGCPPSVTCDQLNQSAQQGAASPDSGVTSASCAAEALGGCTCTSVLPQQTGGGSGTYSIAVDVLTLQRTGSTSQSQISYCVFGNQMSQIPLSAGPDGGVTFAGGGPGYLLEKLP